MKQIKTILMIINMCKLLAKEKRNLIGFSSVLLIFVTFSCSNNLENKKIYEEISGNWNLTHLTYNSELILKNDLETHPYDVPIESIGTIKVDTSLKKMEIIGDKLKLFDCSYEIFYKENVPYLKIKDSSDKRFNGIYTISFSKTIALRGAEYGIEYIANIESEKAVIIVYKVDLLKHDLLNGNSRYILDMKSR